MPTDKSTPRPWFREGKTIYALEHDRFSGGLELFRNRFDCQVQSRYSTPREELEANAALIIKACNSHAALVAALKKAVWELNVIRSRDGVPYTYDGYKASVCPEYFSSVVDEGFAALAAAGETV